MSDLAEQLIGEEEGRSPTVYPDSLGYQTIGIGCLVDPRVPGAGLCDAAISAQFLADSERARFWAGHFPHFAELSPVRQAVLISMCFQLGAKPLHWQQFMRALATENYATAATAGLDSEWARTQTPRRARREMDMLRLDHWLTR